MKVLNIGKCIMFWGSSFTAVQQDARVGVLCALLGMEECFIAAKLINPV
jgi:hypothetical protein